MTSTPLSPPWQGEPWADWADEVNVRVAGQGYIVHSMMKASRSADRLGLVIVALMLLQIVIAVLQVLRC